MNILWNIFISHLSSKIASMSLARKFTDYPPMMIGLTPPELGILAQIFNQDERNLPSCPGRPEGFHQRILPAG